MNVYFFIFFYLLIFVFAFYAEKFKLAAKNGREMFFGGKVASRLYR